MAYTPPNPNGQATSANSSPVVIASDQSILTTRVTTGYTPVTGTITASGQSVTLPNALGVGSVTITVSGTYAGVNLTYQGYDGTNWQTVLGRATANTTSGPGTTTGTIASNATTSYEVPFLLGFTQFRVLANAWTSGTANIVLLPSAQYASSTVYAALTGTVSANLNTGTNRIGLVGLSDGTNVPAMKAASTAAAATDPSLVVNISPNSPSHPVSVSAALPAGANTIGAVNIAGGQAISLNPKTSGGPTPLLTASIGATATAIKSAAGQLYSWELFNSNTSPVYVQLFNAVPANVTLGTTAPYASIGLPAGGGSTVSFPEGKSFGTAITVAVTTSRAGNVAPTNTVDVNFWGV